MKSAATRPSAVKFPGLQLTELGGVGRRAQAVGPAGPGRGGVADPAPPEHSDGKALTPDEVEAWARSAVPGGDKLGVDELREQLAKKVGPVGLAMSGGGGRSARFCLGFLQTLARTSEPGKHGLTDYDYLSTVSGGGYTGCLLSSVAARAPKHGPDGRLLDGPERRQAALGELTQSRAEGRGQPLWQR